MKILFFAWLKTEITNQINIEIDSAIEINELKYLIIQQYGDKAKLLHDDNILVAINHEYANNTDTVTNQDEIAFFPPVTGG